MKTKILLIILMFTTFVQVFPQQVAIIPQPAKLQINVGEFILNSGCSLEFDDKNQEMVRIAGFLNDFLKKSYDFQLKNNGKGKSVQFKLAKLPALGSEGYKLKVDKNGITIYANASAGIFYGFQTLKQLLPLTAEAASVVVPAVEIEDQPRFTWRGNLLDVARHYFPVSFIKKYINILASYKLNVLQLHLTDDQGWRIEIKKYPELTEIAHWREETVVGLYRNSKEFDGIGYGGFYTQEQLRDLVKYAADRFITIIPEIEMPGHASAALAAFPSLGCTGGPYMVQTTWGIHKDVFCAGKDETFQFLQNVLDEVMNIFSSEFIHVGGDECPKDAWEKCAACQQRIKDEGLKDEHELQSWFITRMDHYLSSNGRRLVGWDEILEGGLAPGATVMSWRGTEGGIKAAKEGHDVVMSPNSHLYFDYYQSQNKESEPLAIGGFLPLEKVYAYEPIPDAITAEEAKHILGAQANLWTEYISMTKQVEYMLLPRILALSEVVWTLKKEKDFPDFEKRVIVDYERMKKQGINFRDHRK